MNVLFVHDNRFYKDEQNNFFTGGAFPPSIWKNYFMNFENILFYGRSSNSKEGMNNLTSGSSHLNFHLVEDFNSPLKLLKNISKIKAELKYLLLDSDLLISRLPSILGYIAIVEASKQNKPIWVEQVGNGKDSLLNHGTLMGKLVALPFDELNKILIKKANFISYVTNHQLQSAYPPSNDAITVALSDVVIEKVMEEEELDKMRFFDTTLNIALIGNLDVYYKGQILLLEAISKLPKDTIANINLNFIGGGSPDVIKNKANHLGLDKNIKFIAPLIPGDEINHFLANMSLYTQPSLQEGLPRATVEAMAMGCPVIGSDAGGLPEIINSDFVHDKGDIDKLSEDILRLFNDRSLLYAEALRSLQKAKEFHLDVLLKKRQQFYNEMNSFLSKDS